MKKILLVVPMIALLLNISCNKDVKDVDIITKYSGREIKKIVVNAPFDVKIVNAPSGSEELSIMVSSYLVDDIRYTLDAMGVLTLGIEVSKLGNNPILKATVRTSQMADISASAASSVTVDTDVNILDNVGIAASGASKIIFNNYVGYVNGLNMNISGASSVKFNQILNCEQIKCIVDGASTLYANQLLLNKQSSFTASGASKYEIGGIVNEKDLPVIFNLSGASKANCINLKSNMVTCNLSAASYMSISVSKELTAKLNGASTLEYKSTSTSTPAVVNVLELNGGSVINELDK